MSTDSPSPVLDLDVLVKKHEEKVKDLDRFKLKNVGEEKRTIEFASPEEFSWQDAQEIAEAIAAQDYRTFFMHVIKDDDDLTAWFMVDAPGEVAGRVLEMYLKHNGWDPRRGRVNRADRRALAKG